MEDNNVKRYDEIVETMAKIDEAMKMSKKQQKSIDTQRKKALKENAPLMAQKIIDEIEEKEANKKEFDEMTGESVKYIAKSIVEEKESIEKEFDEKILELFNKKNEINRKFESYKQRHPDDPEAHEKAKNSAEKALEKNEKQKENLLKTQTEKRQKLLEYDEKITDYAAELGIADIVNEIRTGSTERNDDNEEPEYYDEPDEEDIDKIIEEKHANTPKVDEPKVDAPKVNEPKVNEPKVNEPKVNAPKVDAPKVNTPKVDAKKLDKKQDNKDKTVSVDYVARMNIYRLKDDIGEERYRPSELDALYDTEKEVFMENIKEKTKKIYGDLPNLDYKLIEVLYESSEDAVYDYVKSFARKKASENLKIKYDLKGIFDKKYGYSKEEIRQMLDIANTAGNMKIATVEKGLKVSIFEFFDNIVRKFDNKKLLSEKAGKSNDSIKKDDKKQENEMAKDKSENIRNTMKVKTLADDLQKQSYYAKNARNKNMIYAKKDKEDDEKII